MPEYTLLTIAALLAVIAVELFWLRTGIFARAKFWIAMGICVGFQCLVDGWLTKLSDPIVVYSPGHFLGVRFPWDIPIEDFAFGFAMMTLTIMLWQYRLDRLRARAATRRGPEDS